jgi:hypothetical protein
LKIVYVIGIVVWDQRGDIRDVISIGKSATKNDGSEEVEQIVSTMTKYGEMKEIFMLSSYVYSGLSSSTHYRLILPDVLIRLLYPSSDQHPIDSYLHNLFILRTQNCIHNEDFSIAYPCFNTISLIHRIDLGIISNDE